MVKIHFESLQIDSRHLIKPRMHRLGIWINVNVYLFFYVDKCQEFHQTSCHSPVALKANLLFDVHLDEWVLSQPQLHLSFHAWCTGSWLRSIWANLHQRSHHLWLGCETNLPWHWVLLNSNLQVDKVGWSNQIIPCFLLSSSTWFQSWKESLYPGWCRIWGCRCQTLKPFVGWCACSYQTQAILSLASYEFLCFKATCEGPHKFGITK
jgi:hypothetical protein